MKEILKQMFGILTLRIENIILVIEYTENTNINVSRSRKTIHYNNKGFRLTVVLNV